MSTVALKLWELIRSLPEEDQSFIREQLNAPSSQEDSVIGLPVHDAIKPLRKSISVQALVKEQAYQPIQKEAFYEKVSELNIREPLEELLAMLD
ncbi:MAG: hypothetical protein AAGJ82_06960 [Bacteroidota bacterium]